jgi:hypothetical protein
MSTKMLHAQSKPRIYQNCRERTKNVYSIFSRKTPEEAYKILSQMRVQFVVLEESWCFRESRSVII